MPDYSKTIIYKIVCNDLAKTEVYVGNTTDFINRKARHKSNCNNEKQKHYNLKLYQHIRDNGGWGNFSMIEIEKYPCNDGNEARTRERHWFETLNANLNMSRPFITKEEEQFRIKQYHYDNRHTLGEYNKQYYQEHRDHYLELNKQYRQNKKEDIKKYNKLYREEHKEHIANLASEKILCECGSIICRGAKRYHIKSNKHLEHLKKQLDKGL